MNKTLINFDWILFGSLMGLAGLALYSLNMTADPAFWYHQAAFVVAGIIGFILFSCVPLHLVRQAAWPLYAVILLLMVLVWRIGWKANSVLPDFPYAGIMQWALLLVLAYFFSEGEIRDGKRIATALLIVAVPVAVAMRFDVVSAVACILIAIVAAMAAAQWRLLAVAIPGLVLFVSGFWFVQADYEKQRIQHWLFDPAATHQYGYDFLQAAGDYQFILIGLAILMAVLLIWRMVTITCQTGSRFTFTLCAGLTFMTGLYLSEEIALTAGTASFVEMLRYFVVSYDGLAWVGLMAAMGVVMRVAIESQYCNSRLIKQNRGLQ